MKGLVEKEQRKDRKPPHGEDERRKERKGRQKEKQAYPRETHKSWGNLEDGIFSFCFGQNWQCINAAAEGLQKRTEMMERRDLGESWGWSV